VKGRQFLGSPPPLYKDLSFFFPHRKTPQRAKPLFHSLPPLPVARLSRAEIPIREHFSPILCSPARFTCVFSSPLPVSPSPFFISVAGPFKNMDQRPIFTFVPSWSALWCGNMCIRSFVSRAASRSPFTLGHLGEPLCTGNVFLASPGLVSGPRPSAFAVPYFP